MRKFQSTLPVRGATSIASACLLAMTLFQSTLPVRGATLSAIRPEREANISIHAPREGSDLCFPSSPSTFKIISIHAPREGSDSRVGLRSWTLRSNFNPRSP